ncbi:hypothetical protein N7474_004443 [Penicillium riverlandense]|uniref:uncharacterized protein n=1 Tax=Penicillium riverlandense TaxID=1903569 RepID=UPI002548A030|nr:uncharacterized protein N7474_004443 [Penicillium riverlandense]KAJ5818852.1 hypothetical protein N7474_004443 [Penicillium riverlandense]
MPYDRDETVREVTAFYKFLVGTHIPESALKLPPEGGWPELIDEWLSFMGKDPTTSRATFCRAIPIIIRLIRSYTERGTITLVDAQEPTAPTDLSQDVDTDDSDDEDDQASDAEESSEEEPDDEESPGLPESWRIQATYTVPDFFKMIKEEFRTFTIVATDPTEVIWGGNFRSELDEVKGIYGRHGWLTENYRKDQCLKEVNELWFAI